MVTDLTVEADLQFSVDIPGSRTVTGVLTASGKAMQLRVSNPLLFTGPSDAGSIRGLAKGLAAKGVSLSVVTPCGPLVTLGAVRSSWLQRWVTRSRWIRIESGTGLWSILRGGGQSPIGGALPAAELAPPPTLTPLAPTMARRPRRRVTTTHDPNGGGNPRLIMAPRQYPGRLDRQEEFMLRDDVTTIGSGPNCDIRLTGLEPLHAEIRHDELDEFVLVRVTGSAADTRVHGAPVRRARLRTGTGVDLGEWHLSFFREEYADHGRPYGGRIGGELGHQRPQPARTYRPGRDEAER